MGRKTITTKYFSKRLGDLPDGCAQCVEGKKLVLFITGLCSKSCFYCTLSDNKANKDYVWANELKIKSKDDIIQEVKLSSAQGAGITGGDPLLKLDRTMSYINLLKKSFGKKFHIHLYTPLRLVTRIKLTHLATTDLDEIRFHPDLDDPSEWNKIAMARKFKWKIGVEIPVFPDKLEQTKKLVNTVKDQIDFLNLNELELSDNNLNTLREKGFVAKDKNSYAVKGSQEAALKILNYCRKLKINAHYCSAKLKDAVQMRNRLKIRAKNVAKPFDSVTKAGTLIRGVIYLPSLTPSFDYRLKLDMVNKRNYLKRLYTLKRELKSKFNLSNNDLEVDKNKLRIVTNARKLKRLSSKIKKLNLKPAIVEEYPTSDTLEVEVDFL